MNPNLCRLVLRPRGPLEVFDLTVRLIREHVGVFARLGALMVLPPALLATIGAVASGGSPWVVLPVVAVFPLIQLPFTVLAGRLLFSADLRVRDVLREVADRPMAAVAATLWHMLALWGSLLLCGLALPIALPASAYVTEGALLERVGPGRSLRRSMRLAGSNPGIALAAAAGWVGLTAWGALVGETAGQAVVGFVLQLGQPFGSAVTLQVTPYLLLGMLAAQPIAAAYRLLLYVDARTRIEGWDLQVGLRAAGLGAK